MSIHIDNHHSKRCLATPLSATDTPCDDRCHITRTVSCDVARCKNSDRHEVSDADEILPDGWRILPETGEEICPTCVPHFECFDTVVDVVAEGAR